MEHPLIWHVNGIQRKVTAHIQKMCMYSLTHAQLFEALFKVAYTIFRFEDLVTRYEEPDGRNRWDSPLFTVIYDDPCVPQDKLWDAIILKKAPPPNLSTITVSEPAYNHGSQLNMYPQALI